MDDEVRAIDQNHLLDVDLYWIAAASSRSNRAGYVGVRGDQEYILSGAANVFNTLVSSSVEPAIEPDASAANVLEYGLFYLEVTRAMDRLVEVIPTPGRDELEPRWEYARDLCANRWDMTLEERLECFRRFANGRNQGARLSMPLIQQVAEAVRLRGVMEPAGHDVMGEAVSGQVDYLRRLPVVTLTEAESQLLYRARCQVRGGDPARAVRHLTRDEVFSDIGLIAESKTGRPGTRHQQAVTGTYGRFLGERAAGVVRQPSSGLIASVEMGSGYLLSVKPVPGSLGTVAEIAQPVVFTPMVGDYPESCGRDGELWPRDGTVLAFSDDTELYELDADGSASLRYRWSESGGRWVVPTVRDASSAWQDESLVHDLLSTTAALPCVERRENGWEMDSLVGEGEAVFFLRLAIETSGIVTETRVQLI